MTLAAQLQGRSSALLPLFEDESITDILLNGTGSLFVEREGVLEPRESPFSDRGHFQDFIERLLTPLGKRVDAAFPFADGRLSDGSRFHVLLAPLAVEGPFVSIRRWRRAENCPLESFGPPDVVAWLVAKLVGGANVLVVGGTGSGKTTLVTRLLDRVPPEERILIVEESVEIRPRHPHVLHLEARPATPDGTGEVTLRQLLRNALRMRPDRLILGECRGEEAFDLLQALNTGHRGSLSTLHANGCRDGLRRLETLASLTGFRGAALREWTASAVQIVVHLVREGGNRRIREVVSVRGLEGEAYRLQPEFPNGISVASRNPLCEIPSF